MTTPGRFIVFEGLDCSGTSTQNQMLLAWATTLGLPFSFTAEPSDNYLGKVLRQSLKQTIAFDKRTLALLFAADRVEHLRSREGILAQLGRGRHVVCDRYLLSTLAYQMDDDVQIDYLLSINRFARTPDATIFVSTPPDVCARRMVARDHTELFDTIDIQRRVYANYLSLLERTDVSGTLHVVDGDRDPEVVSNDIQSIVSKIVLETEEHDAEAPNTFGF